MNQIEALYHLQEIEYQIENERKNLKELKQSKHIQEKIQIHKTIKQDMERKTKEQKEKENQLKSLEHNRKEVVYKLEEIKEKLYDGHTNDLKELNSLMEKQEILQQKINEIDEKILEIMEFVEERENELVKMNHQEHKLGVRIKKELKERKEKMEASKEKLKKFMDQKEKLVILINQKNMEIYKDIKSRKNHPVAVITSNICTGCHIDLPVIVFEKLKKEEIVLCDNCGRILYNK